MKPAERVKILWNIQFDENGNTIKVAESKLKYLYRIQMPKQKAQENPDAPDLFTYIGQSKSRIPKERILQHITNAYGLPHPYTVFQEYSEEKQQPLYIRKWSYDIKDNMQLQEELGKEGACNANFNIIEIPTLRNLDDGWDICHQRWNVRHLDYLEMMAIYYGLEQYKDFLANKDLKGGRIKGNQSNVFKPKISYLKQRIGNGLLIGTKLSPSLNAENITKYTLHLRKTESNTKHSVNEEIQWYKLLDPCDMFLIHELPQVLRWNIEEIFKICNIQELITALEQIIPGIQVKKSITKKQLKTMIVQTSAFCTVMANLMKEKLKAWLPAHSTNIQIVNDKVESTWIGQGNNAELHLILKLDYKNKGAKPDWEKSVSNFLQWHNSQEGAVQNLNTIVKAEYFGWLMKLYDDEVRPNAGSQTKMDKMHSLFKTGKFSKDSTEWTAFYDQFMDLMNRTNYGALEFDPILHKKREPEFMADKDYVFTRGSSSHHIWGCVTSTEKETMLQNQVTSLDQITVW